MMLTSELCFLYLWVPDNMTHTHIRGRGPDSDSVVGDHNQKDDALGGGYNTGSQNELTHVLLVGDEPDRSFHF